MDSFDQSAAHMISFVVTPQLLAADVDAARVECALKFEFTPAFINILLIHLEIVADCTGFCDLLYELNNDQVLLGL